MQNGVTGLTTAQLAEQTGVPAGTLRMWEARHGFPIPVRVGAGHRRYPEATAEAVRELLRLREEGLSLPAAIARVSGSQRVAPPSIFAALRERRPDLAPAPLRKRPLLALSNAIEDEYCAGAAAGLLIGSFQRERFYRQSERRWRALANASELAVAIADFRFFRHPSGAAAEVPVARDHPLVREWTLIVAGPETRACVAAWERPASRQPADGERLFEVLWSFDPEVVGMATEIAAAVIEAVAPPGAISPPPAYLEPPRSTPALRSASALAHRVVSYLAA